MAKKLKNVLVNSVDLCKQGANQRAFICLKKSMEGKETMSDLKTSIIQNVCKELNITIEDVCKALGFSIQEQETQEQKIKKAMKTSLIIVLKDESKTTEQKEELLQKSVNEFYSTVYDFAKEEQEHNPYYQNKNVQSIITEIKQANHMNNSDLKTHQELKIRE